MRHHLYKSLGPLTDGSATVIIGGGPGGAACAIALKNLAQALGKRIRVILYEGKIFAGSIHYNQCAGVLSPPIVDILEKGLKISFPWDLVQREITGYVLHSDQRKIILKREGDRTYAVRRVNFDDYLLGKAREKGVEVIQSRVTDLEFQTDGVMVYSESSNCRADVVIGAFGMDDGTARVFERVTAYRQPRFLSTIVIKIHPGEEFMLRFGNYIHAFLPPLNKIEFGAVTPKMNHLTINIAGMEISSRSMEEFLKYPPVRQILPPHWSPEDENAMYFKGRFPFRVGGGFYGDRYVIVGDAAGLLRPFKGKGINMSILTAVKAAQTMMMAGISREAFEREYRRGCKEFIEDIPYGKVLRWLAIKSSRWRILDPIVELAQRAPLLENALFDCVSAHKSFKEIFRRTWSFKLMLKVLGTLGLFIVRKIGILPASLLRRHKGA
ncbi:MAG: NAD(P)/FAD-dependent oxidoreductase [Spirochaetota bacterium]